MNLKVLAAVGLVIWGAPSFGIVPTPDMAMDETKAGVAARFADIPAGTFMMGSPEWEHGREPGEYLHQVTLTRGFELQATPVTQFQYYAVMGINPSWTCRNPGWQPNPEPWPTVQMPGCANRPVEMVSWEDTQSFIRALNRSSSEYTYRLPTEAEYEFAARGGVSTPFFWGEDLYPDYNDYSYVYSSDHAYLTYDVAQKRPNPYGLYDIVGNVDEWVNDLFGSYPKTPQVDPSGPPPDGGQWPHVLRGGGAQYSGVYSYELRSAFRRRGYNDSGRFQTGFRLVRVRKSSY